MDQPSASLTIQGLLRPAFIEEQSVIQKHLSDHQSIDTDRNGVGKILDDKIEDLGVINERRDESGSSDDSSICKEETQKDEIPVNGTSFYRLEMIRIQLFSSHGNSVGLIVPLVLGLLVHLFRPPLSLFLGGGRCGETMLSVILNPVRIRKL